MKKISIFYFEKPNDFSRKFSPHLPTKNVCWIKVSLPSRENIKKAITFITGKNERVSFKTSWMSLNSFQVLNVEIIFTLVTRTGVASRVKGVWERGEREWKLVGNADSAKTFMQSNAKKAQLLSYFDFCQLDVSKMFTKWLKPNGTTMQKFSF